MAVVARINRAVADCIILCAYSHQPPREAAAEYLHALKSDPTWDDDDVERVCALVYGLLDRLQQADVDRQGWLK
jgi:hypothetical protein